MVTIHFNQRRLVFCIAIISFLFGVLSCKADTTQVKFEPAPASPITLPCGPGNIVTGDLNHDNKPDIISACGQQNQIFVMINRGDGQFDIHPGSPTTLKYPPNELVIADMNNDKHADLVVGSHDSYDILILPGDGKGGFSLEGSYSVTMRKGSDPHTHGLGIADLNKDGRLDIITANSTDNDVTIMLQGENKQFIPATGTPIPVNTSPYPLTLGDLNKDSYIDIVSTSTNTKNLTVLFGGEGSQFRPKNIPLRTTGPWFVAIGDIDNDSHADMVISHAERRELSVLRGNGKAEYIEVSGSPFDLSGNAWHIAMADLNRDGKQDIAAAANTGVKLMFGDGKGNFTAAPGSPISTGRGTWHLNIIDVSGDGKLDIVTSNLESNTISILLSR